MCVTGELGCSCGPEEQHSPTGAGLLSQLCFPRIPSRMWLQEHWVPFPRLEPTALLGGEAHTWLSLVHEEGRACVVARLCG